MSVLLEGYMRQCRNVNHSLAKEDKTKPQRDGRLFEADSTPIRQLWRVKQEPLIRLHLYHLVDVIQ
jgi:hypothetical protein